MLQTDASERGVGAVLSQHSEDGEEHPVAFFSRTLLPREERYSIYHRKGMSRYQACGARIQSLFVGKAIHC